MGNKGFTWRKLRKLNNIREESENYRESKTKDDKLGQ